jgi:uncharacterized damage-inducible protein DinB
MSIQINLNNLIEDTQWEREKWHEWLQQHGNNILKTNTGPHGDGRFESIGDVIGHIFSAEERYIDKLSGRPLTDTASIPNDNIEELFQFGKNSRKGLGEFFENCPSQHWDVPQEFTIANSLTRATSRKIAIHILSHEIRHWAQIATLFRLNGLTGEFHDFCLAQCWEARFEVSRPDE